MSRTPRMFCFLSLQKVGLRRVLPLAKGATFAAILQLQKVTCGAFCPLAKGATFAALLQLQKVALRRFLPLAKGVTFAALLQLQKVACGAFCPLAKGVTFAALALLSFALPASAQLEDFRTRQLMQDVAELKRVVQRQGQQIEQLEREVVRLTSKEPGRGTAREAPPAVKSPAPANARWTNVKNWDRVDNGMSEKQVLDILGYPTSTRTEENGAVKILFYTVPVGNTGFLSGNVELEKDRVRKVHRPALR